MNIALLSHDSPAYWQTVQLRDEVLRKPIGLEFGREELAAEHDSLHIALYDDTQTLTGCLILKPVGPTVAKMRQVAISPAHQAKGWGKLLVQAAEQIAREHGFERIELHARANVADFYGRLGYTQVGDLFEEVTIPHLKFVKNL